MKNRLKVLRAERDWSQPDLADRQTRFAVAQAEDWLATPVTPRG